MRTQPLSADRRSVKFAHAFSPCTSCGRLIDSRPVEEVSTGRQSGPATFAAHRSAPCCRPGVRAGGRNVGADAAHNEMGVALAQTFGHSAFSAAVAAVRCAFRMRAAWARSSPLSCALSLRRRSGWQQGLGHRKLRRQLLAGRTKRHLATSTVLFRRLCLDSLPRAGPRG
jgi:hypothetical protein